MADAKISALTTLAASSLADADSFVVVDDSVGTTKQVLESTLGDVPALVAAFAKITQPVNAVVSTTYTFVAEDQGKIVTLTNASAITATVPPNSSVAYPIGTRIDLAQRGAGDVTIAAGTGVTVNVHGYDTVAMLSGAYARATLIKIAINEWDLVGDLETSDPVTTLFSDDFNRADSASLGSDWSDGSAFAITSNQAVLTGTGATALERCLTSMGGPNHWAQADIYAPTLANSYIDAVCARINDATNTHYAVWVNGPDGYLTLQRGVIGSYTTITTAASGVAYSVARPVRLQVYGTTIKVYEYVSGAWVLRIDTTDSTYTTGNYAGFSGYRVTGSSVVDNFQCGTGML